MFIAVVESKTKQNIIQHEVSDKNVPYFISFIFWEVYKWLKLPTLKGTGVSLCSDMLIHLKGH